MSKIKQIGLVLAGMIAGFLLSGLLRHFFPVFMRDMWYLVAIVLTVILIVIILINNKKKLEQK